MILAGTNDIAGNTGPMTDEQIEGNLASMAELASANGIKVVLSSITPVSQSHVASPNAIPQTTQRPLARIRAINDWMRQYAAAHQHVYADYFSAMLDEQGLLRSGAERRRPSPQRRRLRDHGSARRGGDSAGAQRCRARNGMPRFPQNECSAGKVSCSIRSTAPNTA